MNAKTKELLSQLNEIRTPDSRGHIKGELRKKLSRHLKAMRDNDCTIAEICEQFGLSFPTAKTLIEEAQLAPLPPVAIIQEKQSRMIVMRIQGIEVTAELDAAAILLKRLACLD